MVSNEVMVEGGVDHAWGHADGVDVFTEDFEFGGALGLRGCEGLPFEVGVYS